MSSSSAPVADLATATIPARPRWLRWLCSLENSLIIVVLSAMVLLPILEIVLRRSVGFGIKGSIPYVQHLTLLVGMLGGALAARENRLLSLSTLVSFLPERWKPAARAFSNAIAATVSFLLAVATWQFVMTMKPTSAVLPYGVPIWVLQLAMPLGFAAVGLRLLWHSGDQWRWRGASLLLTAGILWYAATTSADPERLVWPGVIVLVAATVLGAPIFSALGGVALVLLFSSGRPVTIIPSYQYDLVTDFILPSIPLFTVTGYLLAEGGASRRLVRVFQAAFGAIRGGPAIVTALVCAFFTSFTGASGVTILALGGLLLPVLLAAGYKEKPALGLLTGAGSLGLLFPPCLPLILYAIIAQRTMSHLEIDPSMAGLDVSINKLFVAGLLPGLLLVGLTAAWGIWQAPSLATARPKFNGRELRAAIWGAKWELFLPVGALAMILMGWATPVEAAAATALYALFIEVVVHRDLHLRRDVPRVLTESGLLVGGVLLILGVAMGLTAYLIYEDVATTAVEWLKKSIHSKLVFLLLLNLFLLVVGCLMDIFSALVVVVPLLVPIGLAFGIDPLHLGIIFLANMELGYLTPPVGMNLFLSSYRFKKPITYITRATLPMLLVLGIGVLIITYLPVLTTALPRALFK